MKRDPPPSPPDSVCVWTEPLTGCVTGTDGEIVTLQG